MESTSDWLRRVGLESLIERFDEEGITPDLFSELDDDHLRELGLNIGQRLRFAKAVKDSSPEPAAPDVVDPDSVPVGRQSEVESAQWRQLTVLFVDLVGSTALSVELGAEQYRELVLAYQREVNLAIESFDGFLTSYQGDGVVAYFGWPRASEDAAERAVRAALDVVQRANAMSLPNGRPLAVRTGVATGMVVVGDSAESRALDQVAMGPTPNLAARIESEAPPNGVLISEQTFEIAGPAFECESLGAFSLKGFDIPHTLYAVQGEKQMISRYAAKSVDRHRALIGRDHELGLLRQQWRAAKTEDTRWALVRAAGGLGKSTLLDSLTQHVVDQSCESMVWQCSPLQSGQDFWPVVRQWFLSAGVDRRDPPMQQLATMTEYAERSGFQRASELVTVIGELSGLVASSHTDPVEWRQSVLDLLASSVLDTVARQPLLLVVEDAHWIDPSTVDLLTRLGERTLDAGLCVVIAMRPDEGEVPPLTYDLELDLQPLGVEQSVEVINHISPVKIPSELTLSITRRAEGVPLFLEEFTRAVVSDPQFLKANTGELNLDVDQIDIPASLNDALMARLDRQPGLQIIAQRASVLGREFSETVLARLVNIDMDMLKAQLQGLVHADVIKPIVYSGTENRYTFSHALVQDVAYRSLLSSKRRELHRQVGEFSGEIDILRDRHVWRAGHFAAGGAPVSAITLYLEAIRSLHVRHAFGEIGLVARDALKLLNDVEDENRKEEFGALLYMALGESITITKRLSHPETREAYQKAAEHARAAGEKNLLFDTQFGVWQHLRSVPDFKTAEAVALNLVSQASDLGEFRHARSYHSLGSCQLWLGKTQEAAETLRRCSALRSRERQSRHEIRIAIDETVSIWHLESMCAWMHGEYDRARTLIDAMQLALKPDSTPLDRVWECVCRCMVYSLIGDLDKCKRAVEQCHTIFDRSDMPQWRKLSQYVSVWSVVRSESPSVALSMIQDVEHSAVCKPFYLTNAADVCLRNNMESRAREYIEIGIKGLESSGECWWEPELYRTRGIVELTTTGDTRAATRDLEYALAMAVEREAHALALRAATSCAEVAAGEGDVRRAVELLEPHYQRVSGSGECDDTELARKLLASWESGLPKPESLSAS